MANTSFKTVAEFQAALEELRRAGSPVDLSVAANTAKKESLKIKQVSGPPNSAVFELEDGRYGCRLDIAITNRTTRSIAIVDIQLRTPWGDIVRKWLEPEQVRCQGRDKQVGSCPMYIFPGGDELPYDEVINHRLGERRRISAKRRLEGWLLGVGGLMPSNLHHGQCLDLSLAVVASDHTEYVVPLFVGTEFLNPWAKRARLRASLSDRVQLKPSGHSREIPSNAARRVSKVPCLEKSAVAAHTSRRGDLYGAANVRA